ncbi:MAG: ATP-binding protein [Gracilimonas sp.]|uniref:ATP-binding protein n=1 Tax=Gracilimonas sp. TaxID=1974203 RepID=UPI0037535FA9|nr:ATP-binding protein [Gracilimonas sp.]
MEHVLTKELKNEKLYELMFIQPNQGVMCLALNQPVTWDETVDKERTLDHIFHHMSVLDVNDAMLNMIGVKRNNFVGSTLFQIQQMGIPQNKKLWMKLLDEGYRNRETEIVLLDEQSLIMDGNSICMYEEDGRLAGVFIIQQDVTEQKRLELSVKKRDRLLVATAKLNTHLLQEESTDKAIPKALEILGNATGVDRIHIFKNHAMSESAGMYCSQQFEWTKKELAFQSVHTELQNLPFQENLPRWVRLMEKGKSIKGVIKEFPKREQSLLEPLNIQSILVLPITVKGEFWGFIVFDDCYTERNWDESEIAVLRSCAANIGMAYERYATRKELAESNEIFSLISKSIDEVVYLRTPDMRFLHLNDAYENVFGRSSRRVIEDPGSFTELIHPEDLDKLKRKLGENADESEYRVVRDDGTERYVINRRFPIYDENGDLHLYAGVVSDRTQIRQAQLELESALEKEQELHNLKNRFISMISHEIRTPLTAIISSTELLDNYGDRLDAARKKELSHRILKASQKITGLLEHVLFIGKADAGKLKLSPKEISLKRFVDQIREEVSTLTSHHQLCVSVESEHDTIIIDDKLIEHTLNNLLENAAKYSPPQSRINLTLEKMGNILKIIVQDEGRGIPVEEQPFIFEPFYRCEGVDDIEGTGLGMSVIKRSVDAHGGKIDVDSTLGRGTKFTITIPLKTEEHEIE